jgi:biotin-dependent carboxylase-like uncharacterized protein
MIEVLNPGWMSIIVDGGRYGFADIGVPPSAALDSFACTALNHLLGNGKDFPALEVTGSDFRIKINVDVDCAITGAKVNAFLDKTPVKPWVSFRAKKESILHVKEVVEGLRYYVGFSGMFKADNIMGSYSTNLECRFGGFHGRPLMKGDILGLKDIRLQAHNKAMSEAHIPRMQPPYTLHIIEGPEWERFTSGSLKRFIEKKEYKWYTVSTRVNRTGIRLEGMPLEFRENAEKSITSEGVLMGTIQVPGDGFPIIVLNERTIGGYARIGLVAKVEHDLLAHLKPRDSVMFEMIEIDQATDLWNRKEQQHKEVFL